MLVEYLCPMTKYDFKMHGLPLFMKKIFVH